MCIDAPESTTNYLSSGFIADDAGRHQTSAGEEKVALSSSLSFRVLLASISASLRHIVLVSPFLPEIYPQILAREGYAHEDRLDKSRQAVDHCFLECLRDAVRLLRILHIVVVSRLLCSSVKSMTTSAARGPEIRNPIVVYPSMKLLHFCHHSSSVFAGLIFNLPVRKSTFITEFTS